MSIVQYFGNSEIRFVSHTEGKFEFGIVADDMAAILEASAGKDIARYVDNEWKGALNQHTPGGTQAMTVIWEPGIYQLLAKSRKPQAKPFQKWLFEEILPSIRKTGQYQSQPQSPQQPPQPQLPERDTIDYITAASALEKLADSTLKSLLKDSLIDEIELRRNIKALSESDRPNPKKYTIAKVRAKMLGYSPEEIGNGTGLGKFIHSQIKPSFREFVGKYPVYHYEVTPEFDEAIHAYFSARRRSV